MAFDSILLSAATSETTGISAQTVNAAAGNLGSAIDNTTTLAEFLALELQFQHGSAPTGNWLVFLIEALDGTNYEDGGTSTKPGKLPAAIFNARAVTTAQRVSAVCRLKPVNYKLLVWNDTNQNSSASSVTLTAKSFSHKVGT